MQTPPNQELDRLLDSLEEQFPMAKKPAGLELTPGTMDADCAAALAIERAKGVPIPAGKEYDSVFQLGFCQGAQWALDKIKEISL